MIPGMDPRMMKQAMKRMGIKQEEIDDAEQVIIRCSNREIIIDSPQVSRVNMMGQESFQISGSISEQSLDTQPEISEDDIQTIVGQTGVDEDQAREALEEAGGDLAKAIMALQGED